MVVDDEYEIREMLYSHFVLKGYEVVVAESVDQAISFLGERRFDVVISDIMMPGRLGTELASVVRDEYPMTHVIMITGQITLENALACMRYRADTCIFKPMDDLSELDDAVERAISDIRRWRRKLSELRGMRTSFSG